MPSTKTANFGTLCWQRRQHGRLSVDVCAGNSDLSVRDAAGRLLQHSGDLRRGQGGLHQHRSRRRLSWRRASESAYLLERLVDKAARELGIDRLEIRRRNFIRKDQFPYKTPVALEYDTGDYQATLDMALKAVDYQGYSARREASKKRGKLRGIGFSTYVETCGIARRLSSDSLALALDCTKPRQCASIQPVQFRSSPARTATAKDTRNDLCATRR